MRLRVVAAESKERDRALEVRGGLARVPVPRVPLGQRKVRAGTRGTRHWVSFFALSPWALFQ
jgi:hypothetical protein